MNARRAFAVLLSIATLTACNRKDVHEGDPLDDVDKDTLLREQKQIEVIGEPLRAPKIVVTPADILVNGVRVAPRSLLAEHPDAGWLDIEKVKPLYERLHGMRDHWKAIYPARGYAFESDITVNDRLSFAEGRALFGTIAFVGYGTMTLHTPNGLLQFRHWAPGPPQPDESPKSKSMVVTVTDQWQLRFLNSRPEWSRASDEWGGFHSVFTSWNNEDIRGPIGFWDRCSPTQTIDPGALASVVATMCKEMTCYTLDVHLAEDDDFAKAIAVVARAGDALGASFEGVRFTSGDPCEPFPEDERPAPTTNEKDGHVEIVIDSVTPSPAISKEDLAPMLRAVTPLVRGCYAAPATKPHPAAHVKLNVQVDETGRARRGQPISMQPYESRAYACIMHAFRDIKYPATREPTSLIFSLDLSPATK
jgi:hypothetical protein